MPSSLRNTYICMYVCLARALGKNSMKIKCLWQRWLMSEYVRNELVFGENYTMPQTYIHDTMPLIITDDYTEYTTKGHVEWSGKYLFTKQLDINEYERKAHTIFYIHTNVCMCNYVFLYVCIYIYLLSMKQLLFVICLLTYDSRTHSLCGRVSVWPWHWPCVSM